MNNWERRELIAIERGLTRQDPLLARSLADISAADRVHRRRGRVVAVVALFACMSAAVLGARLTGADRFVALVLASEFGLLGCVSAVLAHSFRSAPPVRR